MANTCMIYLSRLRVSHLSHSLPIVLRNSHESFSTAERQEFYDGIVARNRLLSPTRYTNATERRNNPLTHERIPAGVTMTHCTDLFADISFLTYCDRKGFMLR